MRSTSAPSRMSSSQRIPAQPATASLSSPLPRRGYLPSVLLLPWKRLPRNRTPHRTTISRTMSAKTTMPPSPAARPRRQARVRASNASSLVGPSHSRLVLLPVQLHQQLKHQLHHNQKPLQQPQQLRQSQAKSWPNPLMPSRPHNPSPCPQTTPTTTIKPEWQKRSMTAQPHPSRPMHQPTPSSPPPQHRQLQHLSLPPAPLTFPSHSHWRLWGRLSSDMPQERLRPRSHSQTLPLRPQSSPPHLSLLNQRRHPISKPPP